jgi:5-methylcytosine-specific restriction endonuclease McrA
VLDWINFQVDHIKAYSRGGKTDLSNAALICASCNPKKGAGSGKKKKSI